jgi:hypothetical protein
MKVYELIKELKKHNLNNDVFINIISNEQDNLQTIEDISINCDNDYNDTFIITHKINNY